MSLMYLGIHPLFPVEGVLRVFVGILRIGLNYLKKTKDPNALAIAFIAINARVMTIPYLSYENSGLLDALPSLPKYQNANKDFALEVAGPHFTFYQRIMESCSLNSVLEKAFGSTVYLLKNGRWGASGLERRQQATAMTTHTGPSLLI